MTTAPSSDGFHRNAPNGAERRSCPRYDISWPAMIEVRGAAPKRVEIRNISEGGARVHGPMTLPERTQARLTIDGLSLLVPCVVVSHNGEDTRLQFELEGLGKREFLRQLSRVIGFTIQADAAAAAETNSAAFP